MVIVRGHTKTKSYTTTMTTILLEWVELVAYVMNCFTYFRLVTVSGVKILSEDVIDKVPATMPSIHRLVLVDIKY